MRNTIERCVGAVVGAFVLATLAWILWAIGTPGDCMSGEIFSFAIFGAALGTYVGWRSGLRMRAVLAVAVPLCIAFWSLARDGWWSKAPPRQAPDPSGLGAP